MGKPIQWLREFLALPAFAGSARAQTRFKVLVLAMPDKHHYECIPVARNSFVDTASRNHFEMTWANDPGVLQGKLTR